MKKTKLWKRIAGWLLVFLLVLQLPVNAFAGEWADNTSYSSEENFTDEQAINATRKYVNSFNGDYQYMQLLKYFICKRTTGFGNATEDNSQLLSYIENEGQEDNINNDWTSELK